MKTPMTTNRSCNIVYIILGTALLVACSDDSRSTVALATTPPSSTTTTTNTTPRYDHGHGREVTDLVKHQFEHEFADQCVEREIKNSSNPEVDRQRWTQPCMCIAQYLMKDLTAKEAELFLKQNKNTQSLRIRFEAAAYQCLQKKVVQPAKAPTLFNSRNAAP